MQNLVPHFILDRYAQGETGGRFAAVSLFADISGFSAVTNTLMQHGNEAAETMANVMLAIFDPLVHHIHAHGGFITTFAGDAFTALFPIESSSSSAISYQRALAAAVNIQRHMIANPTQATPYGNFPFTIKLGLGDGAVEWGILLPGQASTLPGGKQAALDAEVKAAYFFSGPAIEAAAAAEHHAQSGNLILSPAVYEVVKPAIKVIPVGDEAARHVRLLGVEGELPSPLPPSTSNSLHAYEAAFIPAAIVQRTTLGDFRQVVSVFVKLMGIETSQDLAIFMQSVFALQQQFGGYLNRVDFGDKGCNMLLYWGMPTSYENDLERALDFVLELGNHTPGTFRAGITYRPMYAGLAGSPHRGEFTCYGDGVNLAARLMMAAPWGSIWLDDRVANRAGRLFTIEYVDHMAFKGFAEKQAVHALVERKQEGEGGGFQGRMVGRRAELAQLNEFAQPLLAAPGEKRFAGIMVIQGEPGSGKSRLAFEFLTNPAWPIAANCQLFVCQTDQIMRQPLNPFRHWLHRYFDQSATQSEARNKRAFSRKLDQLVADTPDPELGKELNRVRSFLGALVNLFWESSLYAQLDPQGRFENMLSALKTLLKAESLRRPVILLLEDAQWLDPDSMEFVKRLIRNVDEYPIAILTTARPERPGALLGEGVAYQQIDLGCLSPEDMGLLIADRLGGPVSPELTQLLIERAECNPFFGEQILLYLREQGAIALQEGEWRLVGGSRESCLPADVRTIFVARLDRLEHRIKEVVQTAAVLGREFEVQILSAMLHGEGTINDQVSAAEREAIWLALSQVRYLFKHSLLRDAAYEMQLRAHRREMHRLAAAAFETLYANDLPARYGEIAYHYEAAYQQGADELQLLALDYLEKAGRRAAEAYQNAAAIDYLSRALAIMPEKELERRFNLLLAREEIYHLQGARQAQSQDLAALAALVGTLKEPLKQAAVALRQAKYAFATGDYAQTIAAAQAAIAAAQAAQDAPTEVAGYYMWGSASERQGDYAEAQAQYTQALELARLVSDRRGEGDALRGLGILAWHRGDPPAAYDYFQQSLAITQALGDRRGEGATLNNLGLLLSEMGEYARAQACYAQALAIRREIGDRAGEGSTLNNLGLLLKTLGNYTEARAHLLQSLDIWREIGSRPGEAVTLDNLGFVLRILGEYAQAQEYLRQALTIEQEIRARKAEGWTLNNLGDVLCAIGDYAQAETFFQQALTLRRESNWPHYVAEDLAGLARVALAQGNPAKAQARIEELLPILDSNPSLDGAEHPLQVILTCYHVLRAAGDTRAADILGRAHARLQELATRIADPDLRRAFLENVPEHREIMAEFIRLQTGDARQPPAAAVTAPPETAPEQVGPAPSPPPAEAVMEQIPEPLEQSEFAPAAPQETAKPVPPPEATQPVVARAPAAVAEGAPPIIIVIENLTINLQGSPGVSVGADVIELLRQLLAKNGKV